MSPATDFFTFFLLGPFETDGLEDEIDDELLDEDTDVEDLEEDDLEDVEELDVTLTTGSESSLLVLIMLKRFSKGDIFLFCFLGPAGAGVGSAVEVVSSDLPLRSFLNKLFLSCFLDSLSLSVKGRTSSSLFLFFGTGLVSNEALVKGLFLF